jgi:hypothetical protein
MEPGDMLLLNLGQVVNDLGRITLLAGTREGLPRGIRLEISDDGRNWRVPLSIPAYWDSLVWSGPHPFVRPEKGPLELIFPPQSGRYLKIVQTGSDTRHAWEIAEVLVYRAIPAPREAAPATLPGVEDLVGRLPSLGIERVWAGPWIQAYLPPEYRIEADPNRGRHPLPEIKGGRLARPPFPAFAVGKEQAAGLQEALQRLDPDLYREIRFEDLTLFYADRSAEGYRSLSRFGWRASANFNNRETGKAFDGKRESRWTSGTPQVPGIWFRLDLGHPESIDRIRLRLGSSRQDFPRRLEIRFSRDGKEWQKAVPWNRPVYWDGENLFREGQSGETDLIFPEMSARYLEFCQTGQDRSYYWSIHEIELFKHGHGSE